MSELHLCVLGAGVIGLTTAIELQNEFPNAAITLLADQFNENTTSFVAPAIFYPGPGFLGLSENLTREWFTTSYNYWCDILTNNADSEVGIARLSGYSFSNTTPSSVRNVHLENFDRGYRLLSQDELDEFSGNWKFGASFSTLMIENGIYLPWATKKFLKKNGKVTVHKLETMQELAGKYDVVVNCTGLGAKHLCNDANLTSIRGQIHKVIAPWIDKFYLTDDMTCIVPGFEGVTLGTTRQFDSFDTNYSDDDELDIKSRCETLLPKLKDAKIIARRVGLRPHRNQVRVEYETIPYNNGSVKVVHNYGHSGYGVTVAPGCAKYAVKLVREALTRSGK